MVNVEMSNKNKIYILWLEFLESFRINQVVLISVICLMHSTIDQDIMIRCLDINNTPSYIVRRRGVYERNFDFISVFDGFVHLSGPFSSLNNCDGRA